MRQIVLDTETTGLSAENGDRIIIEIRSRFIESERRKHGDMPFLLKYLISISWAFEQSSSAPSRIKFVLIIQFYLCFELFKIKQKITTISLVKD